VELIRVAAGESPLTERADAPKAGDELVLLTWFDRASRDVKPVLGDVHER
jgi:hypothetical protein